MMATAMRGYLWERLSEEIAAEFEQTHPFVQAYDSIPFWLKHGWHIEGMLGDMSGVRKSEVHRRTEPSTPSVRSLRERRREEGKCLECEELRHPKSKSYCPRHREIDRQRAAEKRERSRHMREKLPTDRVGVTQKFTLIARKFEDGVPVEGVRELKGYITASLYPATREDGTPHPMAGRIGEVFVKIGKPGDEIALLDEWAMSVSRELQRGADPVEVFGKHRHSQFEPSGAVQGIKGISRCTSPTDLVSNWVGRRFLDINDKKEQP